MKIKSYKTVAKVVLDVCKYYKCEHLVDGKCVNTCKELCPMEIKISEISSKTFEEKGKIYSGMEYLKRTMYNRVPQFTGKLILNKSVTQNYMISVLLKRLEEKEAKEREIKRLQDIINENKVFEKSHAELMEYNKISYNEGPCNTLCEHFNLLVGCMKYSENGTCLGDEACKERGFTPSKDNWLHVKYLEREERRKQMEKDNYSSVWGFYDSSALRGGWCGD